MQSLHTILSCETGSVSRARVQLQSQIQKSSTLIRKPAEKRSSFFWSTFGEEIKAVMCVMIERPVNYYYLRPILNVSDLFKYGSIYT